jgi:isohexenylglutaconyl-CoA hydratase
METLLVDRDAEVLHITLNRPQMRNAINAKMVEELTSVFSQASDARVILLRGAGGNFCAGGDAGDMLSRTAAPAGHDLASDPVAAGNRRFGTLLTRINEAPQLVIAAVEGAAMGGGFGLLCASDLTIASARASFGMPETTLGLVPAQIAPFVLQRIGLAHARAIALTNTRLDSGEALRIGLVHRIADDLDAAIEEAVLRALACAPGAVKATKRLFFRIAASDISAALDDAALAFAASIRGEGQAGIAAFREKRPAPWRRS